MERGPMALFGAIIAVGLGPAMWLGAQFGNVTDVPSAPPAVRSEHRPAQGRDQGGAAGSAPEDPTAVLETNPRADIKPLRGVPRAHPSTSTSTSPGKNKPTADPSESSTAPGDDTSPPPPPSETTGPADPPTGDDGGSGSGGSGGGDEPVQPSPPADSPPGGGTG